jgi:hypothetical protein
MNNDILAKAFLPSLLLASSLAQGAVIQIDFGRGYVSETEVETVTAPGWTPYRHNQTTTANLTTTTGTSSGYTLFHTGNSFSHMTEVGTPPTSPPSPANTYPLSSIYDAIYDGAPRTFTLGGLDNSLTYNLTFFGWVSRGDSRLSSVTINGTKLIYEPALTSTGGQGGVATFLNLSPINGQINFTVASEISNNWILSTLEIQSIPEVGSALLTCLASLPVVLARRRSVA